MDRDTAPLRLPPGGEPREPFRPSEYTAALLQTLLSMPERIGGARVLEVGCGSGVVLTALAGLDPAALCGVDVELEAVRQSKRQLRALEYSAYEVHCGDMWTPVAGRQFDMIVANLPQTPTERPEADRFSTWSDGGHDGRRRLDPFLRGVAMFLTPAGCAIITHSGFVDLDRSRRIAAECGLSFQIVGTRLIHLPPERLVRMTDSVLQSEEGRTIRQFGPYFFGHVHVVKIGRLGTGS
jgi:release factor glutamine methyltransferase